MSTVHNWDEEGVLTRTATFGNDLVWLQAIRVGRSSKPSKSLLIYFREASLYSFHSVACPSIKGLRSVRNLDFEFTVEGHRPPTNYHNERPGSYGPLPDLRDAILQQRKPPRLLYKYEPAKLGV